MLRLRGFLPLLALLVGASVLALPAPAQAAFKLKLTSGVTTVEITDGGGGDLNGATGAITFIGSVGSFVINVSTGFSKPIGINGPNTAYIDLNSINTSSGLGTLTLLLTDTDFTLQGDGMVIDSKIGGTVGSSNPAAANSLSAQQMIDLNNQEYAAPDGSKVTTLSHGPFGVGAFSDEKVATNSSYKSGDKFSITERVVITHAGTATTSFNMESTVTNPVPPSIVLSLGGLPMLAGGWFLQRRRAAKALAA